MKEIRWEKIKEDIENTLTLRLNKNQWKDIKRLLYEIKRRDNREISGIIRKIFEDPRIKKTSGRNRFFIIKDILIKERFPLTSSYEKIDTKTVFLTELKKPIKSRVKAKDKFYPQRIFVEKKAKNSYLTKRFTEMFPEVPKEELSYYGEYLRQHKFSLEQLKSPLAFIVKEQWDFIKPCPCTKYHLRCNYWIFNLGFGCPFDCSYCYLQQYTNFPGIILPANLDTFFNKFIYFYRKISHPIRIGTGEFCDSLALDEITNYASKLISFFTQKDVFFELKTKSNNIENILNTPSSSNIIISWSLNPQEIIESEEKNTVSLKERLNAAYQVKNKGYSIAFHFDPIIHYPGWENDYKEVVNKLYSVVSPPFRWISLGTLRGARQLKNIVEQRFPESNIFYGELFISEDKKLRYPKFLRKEIYKKMVKWIREYDIKTPIYLCMEDKEVWSIMDKPYKSSEDIEKYLLGKG